MVVLVREFEAVKDSSSVEDLERRCEAGPNNGLCIFTDLLGDPLCRIRNSSAFLMLVAEVEEGKEIVGIIRGCVKTVTRGNCNNNEDEPAGPVPVTAKVGYILGLRVSSSHRRMGIGLKLVLGMEQWFTERGVEYSYMATEKENEASVCLFTCKCGYSKFRTPSILVQPVFAHNLPVSGCVAISKLPHSDAESLYRRLFSCTEFFPQDIDAVLQNELSVGTFLAVPRDYPFSASWPGSEKFLAEPPESWAVSSVWNCKEKFLLEVRGASLFTRLFSKATRLANRALSWLHIHIPSIPPVFQPFGFHMLYGLGGEGPDAAIFMKALCNHAHNLAKNHGCAVVVAEVASTDPLRVGIPFWKSLSSQDLWCIKRLPHDSPVDWTMSPPGISIFVDPRGF